MKKNLSEEKQKKIHFSVLDITKNTIEKKFDYVV